MFGDEELEKLRLRKEVLAVECDAYRVLLAAQCRRLRQPGFWMDEAGKAVTQHPMLATVLGLGAGAIAMQTLRKPRSALGWLGKLSTVVSAVRAVRKFF